MRMIGLASTLALAAAIVATTERDARACGGCFSPPTETNSVVTDHRMILSVSPQQTTLYDQIRYTGNPSSFAWVLPINGTATVGLSADLVFGALDSLTQAQVQQPPTRCPAPPQNCQANRSPTPTFGAADTADAGSVTVTKQEVVGPYETVQLKATDAGALEAWLATNNYNIPADVKPVIDAYVAGHYDFLAMKLVPGASVQSMRPVRVTTAGASPVLPLRMVAAGTGAVVGITLWIVGEGRYEPQNFASFQITSDDLVWNWASSSSNYKELRAQRSLDGKTWEIESSTTQSRDAVENRIRYPFSFGNGGPRPANPDAGADYAPSTFPDGGVKETPDQVRDADLATLFAGIGATPRITRIRADLARAALAAALPVQPAKGSSELAGLRIPKQEAGQPQCPIYNGCDYVGTGPRDQAEAQAAKNAKSESFGCRTAQASSDDVPVTLMCLAGFLGFAVLRSRRRRT